MNGIMFTGTVRPLLAEQRIAVQRTLKGFLSYAGDDGHPTFSLLPIAHRSVRLGFRQKPGPYPVPRNAVEGVTCLSDLEKVRQRLNRLASEVERLDDPELLTLAHEMDVLVLEEMRKQATSWSKNSQEEGQ